MFKRALSLFLAILMAAGMFPFTSLTVYAAKHKDVNYFYPTMDTEREYKYIERANMEFSGNSFNEGCWIDAWPTGLASTYTFNYLGSYYEYKNSAEYMPSVAKIASDIAWDLFDIEMNEIIIYRVDRGDGLDPLYGAVIAYDPMDGVCFYAVSTPDGAPVIYNFTNESGSIRIDVEYYTDHGLGTKEIYHTVTFRDDDGTFLSDQEVRSGKNAILPSPPRKNGVTAQWNHTGEFIEQDTDIFADYTGGEVFKPERPEDYYSAGQQPFIRNDYNQQGASRLLVPTDVENMVAGHTFEDVQVIFGLWDNQKRQLKELGTYGELKSEMNFRNDFVELCEYLCETYSFNMNDIMCYDSGMVINGNIRPCVVMGYDYEYCAVAVAYDLTDMQVHLYSTEDLRDQYIDITFDIDIMSGHATRETHTVKYVTENGSPISTVIVQDGKSVKASRIPEVPEKDGYEGVWSHDGTGITGDMTIYPVYTRTGGEPEDNGPYTVNFYMPAWMFNLRSDEPAADENGNACADEDFVLIHSEEVEHGENVKNIPVIPWEASEPYEWYDWNDKCTDITENKDVLVVCKSGGKRVYTFDGKEKEIKCGSPYSAYGTIHTVTAIDSPDYRPYIGETEIGGWFEISREDITRTYRISSADVLPKAEKYKFICTYADGVEFPVDSYYYEFTASEEHLTDEMIQEGTSLGYKGLFGDLTAEDLYPNDPEAEAKFEALAEIVDEVAAEYKLNPKDVPIHGISRDGGDPDDEYVVWLSYTLQPDGIFICEHGYHYYMHYAKNSDKYGKTIGTSCGGTVENISKKALEYENKEASPVDLCTVTFTFSGTVISEIEAPVGSEYELPEPKAIRGYKAEGWKYNGELVGKTVVLEGNSMVFEASYVEEAGANTGVENTVFGYAYYFDTNFTVRGFTTDKGTVNIGKLRGPQYEGLLMDDMSGEFVLEHVGTYDDLEVANDDYLLRYFWEDILEADEEYTPTAKKIPVYKLSWDGEFFSYGIIRAYDSEKGALIFDGPSDNDYLISMSPLKVGTDILFSINYDGSALPYFAVDTIADNVIFSNAWSVDKVSSLNSFRASGMTDPIVDQYGTVGSVSGKWNLEKLGKYSEIKAEVYSYYLEETIKNAAALMGVSVNDVTIYDFRNGNTHVAYGAILGQSGDDSHTTKLLFLGDTTKEGGFFCISHESDLEEYYALNKKGNTDYSTAIKKDFDDYVTVSFYAEGVKVDDIIVASGAVITEFPEVPAKEGYIGSWDYDNSPITGETRIEAVYEFAGDFVDDPKYNKNYRPMEKELATRDIVAIRAENALLSYVDNKGIIVEEDEQGEINAPSKKVQWVVTVNEDGSLSFTNTTTGKLLAVTVDENGNTKVCTVADSEEINPGDDIPGMEEGGTGSEGGEDSEGEESSEETVDIYSYWVLESGGGSKYLKLSGAGKDYYLALSGEGEWTAGETGSPITFWQNPEELVQPERPAEPEGPEDPDDPESGNGPLSKEELDKKRPTTDPKDFMAAESLNPGDQFILYYKDDFDDRGNYRLLNDNSGGNNLTYIGSYNEETGAVKPENVPQSCIWTLEENSESCPLCEKPLYFLKNVDSGKYIVYGTGAGGSSKGLFFTSDLEDSSETVTSVHLEYKEVKTEDTVTRTIADFYYHYIDGQQWKKLYITIWDEKIFGAVNGYNSFYVSRPGENKEYYAVQYLVDGEVYDVKYAFEGTEIEHPELPEKEGYSYCWPGVGNTVTVEEDMVIEAIVSKDITEVYGASANIGYSSDMSQFRKGNTKSLKVSEGGTEEFYDGYNSISTDVSGKSFVIGELGYLKDYTNTEHKEAIEKKYKNGIIENYGQEAFDNLKLHTINVDGKIIGIGFIGGYFDCDADSENKTGPTKCRIYHFETNIGNDSYSAYFTNSANTYYQTYGGSVCGWDPSCSYDDLFSIKTFGPFTVTFKDLDRNIVHQEEVPYYGDVQIIPDVPEKEGYEGKWFATEELYTGIFEDKVIYPIYYEVMAEHGTIANVNDYGPKREFFDNDYSTALYENFFREYLHNGMMSSDSNYTYNRYGNTITLGYIGDISDLAIYTENDNGFSSIADYKKEEYRTNFNSKHYENYSKDHSAEDEIELPVFVLINEETGEILEIMAGYSAFAMYNEEDSAEYPVVGIFDPQLNNCTSIYTTRPADKPVSIYSPSAMSYLRPLWHFKDGTENFSMDIFSGLKNIEVTYVNENGETVYSEMVSLDGSVENIPAVPEKEGYTGAWDHNGTDISGEITISPVYTQITHTVTINLDAGRSYELEVVHGEDVGLPSAPPAKAGYIGSWDHDGKNITKDTVINAVYEKQTFTVTFVVEGETVATQTVTTGNSANLPGIPEKAGYNGKWDHDGKNITADTVITAVYTTKIYEVEFVAGKDTVSYQEVEHGQDAEVPEVPEKVGHTGSWKGNTTNITSDRIIRATYSPIKYQVIYIANGEVVSTQEVPYGRDANEPDVPEVEGKGGSWNHDGKNITGTTIITATYVSNVYTVKFYEDGKLVDKVKVNHGENVSLPEITEKEGYDAEWNHSGKNITKDTTIKAVYTPETYSVVFFDETGNNILGIASVEYGKSVKTGDIPAIPEKEGKSGKWNAPLSKVVDDMAVYPVYTDSEYRVIFYLNGKQINNQVVKYGENVVFPNVAQVEGCTVVWDKDGNNVKGDLNIYGTYKLNGYTVDKVVGTTNEVIPAEVSYGYTYGNAIGTGNNEKLDLTKLNIGNEAYNLVFWREDISAEGSFTLSVPEQVEAPVVEIDYAAGTTKDIVGTDVYYGTNENAMTTSGTNEKLTLVPGTTYYFYRPSDGEKLPSDTTEVCTGQKETMPDIGIDYSNVRTDTDIGSDIIYGTSEDEMVNTGEGEKISLTPGQDIYFQRKGSEENQTFSSDIFHLVVPERPVITRYSIKDETIKGKGDGRLYNLTKNIKYRWQKVDSNSYYTATFAADYISVKPGEWKLRIQPTDTSFASEYVYFTIEEGRALSLTVLETKGGETLNVIEGLSYREAIPVPEDPTRKGYVFDGWYWDNNGNESAFKFSSGISTDRIVYAKWTEAEEEVLVNELSGDKWIADFGTVFEDLIVIPEGIDVTVTNNGQSDINIIWEEPFYYSISGPETIAAGASAVYTIKPLESLTEAGNYDEEIFIYNADNFDSYCFINALYEIVSDEDFDVSVKEDGGEVDEDGIVVEVGGEIELEAGIAAPDAGQHVLYRSFRAAPAPAKAVPAGFSVRWEDAGGNLISTELKCKFGPFSEEGYYHYILVVTGPKGNSVRVPITIYAGDKENDNRITISPKSYRFGTDRNRVAEFIISNFNGTEAVELTNFGSLKEFKGKGESSFIFGGELFERIASGEKVVLELGESISFTVQPKEGLEPGIHAEMVGAGVGNGTNYALAAVAYTEPEKLGIDTENELTVFTGSNVKLSAKASGGSGKYTYEWVNTELGKVVSRKSSALFGSSYTKEAGTLNLEVTVTDSNGNTVTEKVKVNIVEHSYDIVLDPEKLDFGTDYRWFENAKEQTVTLKNIGNSNVTLKGIESKYFDVSDIEGIVLEPGESIEITVAPKDGLAIGEYREDISIITEQGTKAELAAVYKIIRIFGNGSENKPSVPEKSEDEQNPNTGAEVILP